MQGEQEHIRAFIDRVMPHLHSGNTDINEIREAYLNMENLFERLNYYALEKFERHSSEGCLQYDLRFALESSVEKLLKSNSPAIASLLDSILDRIPAVLLVGYPLELVAFAHNGYFLSRLEAELIAVFNKQIKNRSQIGHGLYVTHPTAKELLNCCPQIAQRVLPLVFQYDWGAGFRMAFADALYDFGDRSEIVEGYRDLLYKHFSGPFFRGPACFESVKAVMEYRIAGRVGTVSPEEISPFETLLKALAQQFPESAISQYLGNKWHGDNWYKRTIKLANGWQFKFQRAPYIEEASIYIEGGEIARDDVVAHYPEQEQWLHKTLAESSLGSYSVSWVIHFAISSNELLNYLLMEIEKLGIVEDTIIPPV